MNNILDPFAATIVVFIMGIQFITAFILDVVIKILACIICIPIIVIFTFFPFLIKKYYISTTFQTLYDFAGKWNCSFENYPITNLIRKLYE